MSYESTSNKFNLEVENNGRRFEVLPATVDDAVGIGEAHLQAWVETYPNEEYGVTEDWIRNEFGYLVKDGKAPNGKDNGIPFRRKVIEKLDEDTIYEVVKDEDGVIQGFAHVDKTDTEVHLNAIYLTNNLKGTGVAQKIMDRVLDFFGDLPMVLQVVSYNERAIKFYERNGFVKMDQDKELFHSKMPVTNMKRSK